MSVRVLHDDGILGEVSWMKLCALLMYKLDQREVRMTIPDIESFAAAFPGEPTVVVDGRGGKDIVLRLMSLDEAEKFYQDTKKG